MDKEKIEKSFFKAIEQNGEALKRLADSNKIKNQALKDNK